MMSYTQESKFTENTNHTYNANDRDRAKHIETNRVDDQVYT